MTSIFTVLFAIGLNAQTKFGVKLNYSASINSAETSYIGSNSDIPSYQLEYQKSLPSFSAGAYVQHRSGNLFGQAELLINRSKNQFSSTSFNDDAAADGIFDETSTFIQIPVIAGVYHNGISVGVGPMFHFLVDHQSELEAISYYEKDTRVLSAGFQVQVGFDVSHFHFDLRYENTFRTVGDHINYGTRPSGFQSNPNVITLGTAFTF